MTSTAAVFNENYYLTNNADVVLAISQGQFSSAIDHYNSFGGRELRQPNETFNPSYYAINNADVLSAVSAGGFANVFAHYQEFGEVESRAPSTAFAGFDSTAYLAANADVAAAVTAGSFASALDHFITFGQNESRSGSGVTESTGVAGSTFTLSTGLMLLEKPQLQQIASRQTSALQMQQMKPLPLTSELCRAQTSCLTDLAQIPTF